MVAYRKLAGVLVVALSATLAGATAFDGKQLAPVVESADFEVELSRPDPGSPRAMALAALDTAQDVTLYSLQPWEPPTPPDAWRRLPYKEQSRRASELWRRSEREWCSSERCYYDNRVLGKTRIEASDLSDVHRALQESLGQVPDYAAACVPEFRHAVAFVSAGKRYDVLLCYGCGQVAVYVDGDSDDRRQSTAKGRYDRGQTHAMGEEAALDGILARAGIALAAKPD